jgi:hypothetical protein
MYVAVLLSAERRLDPRRANLFARNSRTLFGELIVCALLPSGEACHLSDGV